MGHEHYDLILDAYDDVIFSKKQGSQNMKWLNYKDNSIDIIEIVEN